MAASGRPLLFGTAIAVVALTVFLALRGCDHDADAPPPSDSDAPRAPTRTSKPSRPRGTAATDAAAETASASPVPQPAAAGASMTVRVRDRDGQPVPGARALVRSTTSGSVNVSASAGADGVARVAGVPEGPLVVQWHGPSNEWQRGLRVVASARDLDVVLDRLARLAGTVTVPEGTAAFGIVVLEVERADAEPLASLPALTAAHIVAKPTGAFEFAVPPGRWFVRVARREFAADDGARFGPFDAGTADIKIALEEWPRIEARVEAGEGAGACGWMWFERDGGESPTPFVFPVDGKFRSPRLKDGAVYDLVARGDSPANGGFWAIARGIAAGTSGLVLESKPARTIRARLVDAKGNALREQVVVRTALRVDAPPGPFDISAMPRQGEFAIDHAPWFAVHLVAGGVGTTWWTPDPPTAPEGDERVVTIVAEPTVFVRGRVETGDGTPVRGGTIGASGRWTAVQSDGTFALGGCIPGRAIALEWLPAADTKVVPLPPSEVKAVAEGMVVTLKLP